MRQQRTQNALNIQVLDGLLVGASRELPTLRQHRSLNSKPNLGIIPRQSEAL